MTLATQNVDVHTAFDAGPVLQFVVPSATLSLASTILANSNINSNLILTNGFKYFGFGLISTQAGTVSIQRYLDAAGTIPQGNPVTGTLVASTALTVNSIDNDPFQSIKINISNSAGSTATLSNVILLLQAE